MKNLYIIGGTMGVGKTAACVLLKRRLENAVFLDGDWCWDANPFQVTEETKAVVLDNICHMLNNFLRCTAYQNIIFCWVMHEQEIIDSILSQLETRECNVRTISLICSSDALTERLQKDIDRGVRHPGDMARSVDRLPMYQKLRTVKLDVSNLTPEEAAERIAVL